MSTAEPDATSHLGKIRLGSRKTSVGASPKAVLVGVATPQRNRGNRVQAHVWKMETERLAEEKMVRTGVARCGGSWWVGDIRDHCVRVSRVEKQMNA
jgi:hypothetical protein